MQKAQNADVHRCPDQTNQNEEHELHGDQPAHHLVEKQDRKFQNHQGVELAFAELARAHAIGQLAIGHLAVHRQEEVQKDLEALAGKVLHGTLQECPLEHEKTAHRVGEFGLGQPVGNTGGKAADGDPGRRQVAGAALGHVAAVRNQLDVAFLQEFQHRREPGLVVLHIRVDHRDEGGVAGQHAFDAGRGKAAAADPLDAAHPRVLGEASDRIGGAIGRIVVDEDHFPGNALERLFQGRDHRRHVGALVEGWDNDGQFAGHAVFLAIAKSRNPRWSVRIRGSQAATRSEKRQPSGARKGQRSVCSRQRHLDDARSCVDIADRDQVPVAR